MSLKKITDILPLVLLLVTIQLTGQERFTLEQLIQLALQENYQIRIVQKQQQMAENLNTPGNAGMLPSIGIASDNSLDIQTSESKLYTGITRSGTNASSTRASVMAELDWTVFDGFAMFAERDRLALLASLGAVNTRYYVEQTIADLAASYYLLVKEQQLLDTYRQLMTVSAFRLELEEKKFSIGSGNALLYNQALLDLHADSILLLNQMMQIRDQQIRINRIINRSPGLLLDPAEPTIPLHGIPISANLTEKATAHNIDLERAKLGEILAETSLRIERGQRYPQVSVFSNYGVTYQTSETGIVESARSHGAQFGFRIRFNLYDGGRQTTSINNALLAREGAELSSIDIHKQLESDLARLTEAYLSLEKQSRLLNENLDAATRSLQIAREQFLSGLINGYDFRQTQLTSLRAENQLIELRYAMKMIEIDMDRITGKLMENVFQAKATEKGQ
ncbi:MAG: TolC family protein [Bacteroidales bacterium]